MRIFIPSLGRANIMHRATLSKIPESWLTLTTLVCQAHEAEEYEQQSRAFGCGLLVLPEEIKRITPTREYIGRMCQEEEIDKMVMLDDDIEFYTRRKQFTQDEDWWKLSAPDDTDVELMLNCISVDLDTYAHVGVSGREGNNRVRDPFVENTRYMRLLAYRTDMYMACEHGRVEVMEDFDIALQLLRAGHKNKVYYRWAQGQAKTQAAGGCSVWRTHDVHNAGAERLAELHPQFVRTRQKENKTDAGGFGTRTEVTVQWKRAFGSSIEKETE